MSSLKETCRVILLLTMVIIPTTASGQNIRPNAEDTTGSSHRPWIGVSLGTGFVGGDHVEPDDSRDFGLSLDIPLRSTIRLRAGAGRMSVNGASFGGFPLQRLTFDAVVLRPFPKVRRACQSHFVAGGGVGLYRYGLGGGFSETRRGYQIFAGGECVGSRGSFGLDITGRSIGGPANLRLPDDSLFALDMHLAVRLRL